MIKHPRIENATNNLGRVLVAAAVLALASGLAVAGAPRRADAEREPAMKDIEDLKRAEKPGPSR